MLLTCNKCFASSDHRLDLSNGSVVCNRCGQEIDNISPYMKNALKSSGQVTNRASKIDPQINKPKAPAMPESVGAKPKANSNSGDFRLSDDGSSLKFASSKTEEELREAEESLREKMLAKLEESELEV